MASAFASQVFSRRHLIQAMAGAIGVTDETAMRRPGKAPLLEEKSLPQTTAATPPGPVRWLQKATFGFTQGDYAAFYSLPGANDDLRWQSWVSQQLNPAAISDTACDARLAGAGFTTLGKTLPQLWAQHRVDNYTTRMQPIAEIECATSIRAIYSNRQLYEVMADFWHDHFSTFGWDYDGGPVFVHYDRDVIRPNVFGNFRTLLEAVCKSTTMMYYLDLQASTVAGPNENYARELIELHTLGAENYAGVMDPQDPSLPVGISGDGTSARLKYVDEDVYESTRVLTGWTIKNGHWQYPADNDGTFIFRDAESWHDRFTKYVLNRRFAPDQGQQDGFKLFDTLASHPGTANFIARKLCRRFVGDNPPSSLVTSIAQLFMSTWQAPDQLKQVTQAILLSNEFKTSWGTKVKRPFNAVIGALRGAGADFTPTLASYGSGTWSTKDEVNSRLQQTGQRKFYWPAPNGYPDTAAAWSSSGSLAMTWKMLVRLTEIHKEVGYDDTRPYLIDIIGLTNGAVAAGSRTAVNIVNYWCDRLLGFRPEPTYTKAVDYLRQNAAATEVLTLNEVWAGGSSPNLKNHYTQSRLRATVALIMCSPDALRR
ncbi:uncharacterized protein DUF1800 [Tahibacter aquaticus]|uniref:Uncharacterized protein DUF1800 n=1 Tax=Tahibacter aquaticus TaxID=520092 RepID=A0A4R6YTR7_9GAMM|nr:DUF1800 domain-containing protein [Tahibacter aquaticus]TDR41600.1 uncharacterized protein DUF1800 [Tahibacter aquaticus]